jgi:hypothetical protein
LRNARYEPMAERTTPHCCCGIFFIALMLFVITAIFGAIGTRHTI